MLPPSLPLPHARLPSERVDLQRKFLQEAGLGGVGQDEDHVHVAWPQADQVAGVCYVREFSHLHKALLRDLAVEKQREVKMLPGKGNAITLKRNKWKKTLL